MLERYIGRENRVLAAIDVLSEAGVPYVLVGGYAIAAWRHRYSVDADLVVRDTSLGDVDRVLRGLGFEKGRELDILPEEAGRFIRYGKGQELPVNVDLLVNLIRVRQTRAFWRYDELDSAARVVEIPGTTNTATGRIASAEALLAMKVHASRLTDVRDAVALASLADADGVVEIGVRGQKEQLKRSLDRCRRIASDPKFVGDFESVSQTKSFDPEGVEALRGVLDRLAVANDARKDTA